MRHKNQWDIIHQKVPLFLKIKKTIHIIYIGCIKKENHFGATQPINFAASTVMLKAWEICGMCLRFSCMNTVINQWALWRHKGLHGQNASAD